MANYYQGDTVKLRASFRNFAGALEDRTSVTVKIYSAGGVQVGADITGASVVRESTGIYYTLYTLPLGYSTIIYEFSGLDSESKPHLARGTIGPVFAT